VIDWTASPTVNAAAWACVMKSDNHVADLRVSVCVRMQTPVLSAAGHSSMLNPASAPIQHFHAQDNVAQPARPPPRRGAAVDGPAAPTPPQGPDLLLGWRTQQGRMGVHHLYNCHLKVYIERACYNWYIYFVETGSWGCRNVYNL